MKSVLYNYKIKDRTKFFTSESLSYFSKALSSEYISGLSALLKRLALGLSVNGSGFRGAEVCAMAFSREERKMDCQLCRVRKAEADGLCGSCQQVVAERDARITRSLIRERAQIDAAYRRLEVARANYNAVRTSPRVRTLSQAEYERLSAQYSAEYEAASRELRGLGVSID